MCGLQAWLNDIIKFAQMKNIPFPKYTFMLNIILKEKNNNFLPHISIYENHENTINNIVQ